MALATTFTATDWWDTTLTTGNLSDGQIILVQGYYAAGDGGGGRYVYHTNQQGSGLENGGTIVRINASLHTNFFGAAAGWFYLLYDGIVTLKQFGAIGDNADRLINGTVNSHQRFPATAATARTNILTRYLGSSTPTPVGKALELLETGDTLDWVSIQSAFDTALKVRTEGGGFKLIGDVGEYVIRKPLWVGWGEHKEERDSNGNPSFPGDDDAVFMGGFVFEGVNLNTGANGKDPHLATVIKFITDEEDSLGITNRITLRLPDPPSGDSTFKLRPMWGDYSATATIRADRTATQIADIVDNLTHVGSSKITAKNGTGSVQLDSKNLLVLQFEKDVAAGTKSFHGEMQVAYFDNLDGSGGASYGSGWSSGPTTKFVRSYADSGIISFRGLAQKHARIANVNILANPGGATVESTVEVVDKYVASFGILNAHTQFTKFELENVFVRGCRWGYGIMEGNAANGENTLVTNFNSEQCYGVFILNAGQALQTKFLGGTSYLNGPLEPADTEDGLKTRTMVELGGGRLPGYDVSFIDFGVTMEKHFDGEGATDFSYRNRAFLFKTKGSKTGVVSWRGSRCEHVHTFVEWDTSENGQNLHLMFDGVDLDGIVGRTTHPFLKDIGATNTGAPGNDYAISFKNCRMSAWDNEADDDADRNNFIVLQGSPFGRAVASFEKCHFNGFVGRDVRCPNFRFDDCLWRQRGASEYTVFQEKSLTTARAGSLFDLPRAVPSGPSQNRLAHSSEPVNDVAFHTLKSPWVLKNAAGATQSGIEGFQKPGHANNTSLGLTAVSSDSFAVKFDSGLRLYQVLTPLAGADDVVTYEAHVQVLAGSFTISLADDETDSALIYDSILLRSGVWRLVHLTAVGDDFQGSPPTLRVRSEENDSIMQVAWQAAYHGSGPHSPVRTGATVFPMNGAFSPTIPDLDDPIPDDGDNRQSWTHVLPDLRVAGRLVVPYKADTAGYRAASPNFPELRSGEQYLDNVHGSTMMYRGDAWYVADESARWFDTEDADLTWDVTDPDHNHRFVIASGSTNQVILKTENVPNGMRVGVFNDTSATIDLVSKTGMTPTTLTTIDAGDTVTAVFRRWNAGTNGWRLESRFTS
ncbi:MAG: hypothetical protein JSS66_02200 [Armatimonadetes bacterium]|nr:hypothetical protein [Armatimonadota bacterium]